MIIGYCGLWAPDTDYRQHYNPKMVLLTVNEMPSVNCDKLTILLSVYHCNFIFLHLNLHVLALAILVSTPVESLQPLPQLSHKVDRHHVSLPTLQSPVEFGDVKLPVGVVNVLEDLQFSTISLLNHSYGIVVEGLD